MNTKVSIQGVKGAFHDIASRQLLGDAIQINASHSFSDLVSSVNEGRSDVGVMAIENTIAGSLLQNYHLINDSNLFITGETYLRIEQNMMAHPGVKVDQIKEVHSHPIALAQCVEFFKQYPSIKLIEARDTAEVAQRIKEEKLTEIGAVASDLAAEIYGLDILAKGVETNKQNFTRFLQVETKAYEGVFDKVSVTFRVSHDCGSLHNALGSLVHNGVNLTKIQSVPVLGEPFTYRFYADFVISSTDLFDRTIIDLSRQTEDLKVLGKYKSAKRP